LCGQIDEISHMRLVMRLMVSLQSNDGCYWSLEWWIVNMWIFSTINYIIYVSYIEQKLPRYWMALSLKCQGGPIWSIFQCVFFFWLVSLTYILLRWFAWYVFKVISISLALIEGYLIRVIYDHDVLKYLLKVLLVIIQVGPFGYSKFWSFALTS
jgi:uncharacterized membrane protein SpoIIM required for sporulation